MNKKKYLFLGLLVLFSLGFVTNSGRSVVAVQGLISDTTARLARIDGSTHAAVILDYEHHEIHSGSSFTATYTQTVSDTDDQSIIAFKTPNTTKYVHITLAASATTVATASVVEAPTITDDAGATLAIYNRRRAGTPTATTVIDTSTSPDTAGQGMFFTEATQGNVTGGTELVSIPLGSSGPGINSVGGLARGQQEWILAPNTLYAFIVNSDSDADNILWVEVDYYELVDKN